MRQVSLDGQCKSRWKTETLNLQYDPDIGNNTDDDFTSNSSTEEYIGEDSDPEDRAYLFLTVNEREENVTATSKNWVILIPNTLRS